MTKRRNPKQGGFTFVELAVAGAVLVTFAAIAFAALTQLNGYATLTRLRSHALALAQQSVDEIHATQWRAGATRPALLASGTKVENNVALNTDSANAATDLKSSYTDLATPNLATRTVQITDVTARTLRATVTVTFSVRNRTHTVRLTTMRATDTI